MSFSKLQLNEPILKAIKLCGYTAPTPIQSEAIPQAIAGHDLIATAQTGTGKTAAFVMPALMRLSVPSASLKRSKGPRVLVLTPTRELANQVTEAVKTYGKFMRIRSGAILGGMPYFEQQRLLSQPVDLIVATPGRLIDHMERGRIDFSRLELLILDEADRMLDMGFSDAVDAIAKATPADRQTLMFTATMDNTMAKLAQRLLKEPVRIEIAGKKTTLEAIEQRLHAADDMQHKSRMLNHLIADSAMTRAIIFSGTKRNADQLAIELSAQGHSAAALHGDMSQGARNRTIMNMKRGKIRLLVATDVAARGLDVTGITHVINYDLPKNAEDYVHRIGRTGRAGASGIAISFASGKEVDSLRSIERYIGQTIPQQVIPGLEPSRPLRRTSSGGSSRPGTSSWKQKPGFSGRNYGKSDSARAPYGAQSKRKPNAEGRFSRDARPTAKRDGGKTSDFRPGKQSRQNRWA
ncbi:MAG: DEAD/DEAH box helicase [Nitrospiraceae bacterium]|nr:DEAD/DEAH box helicase [Nitrospiraceae bacterium]